MTHALCFVLGLLVAAGAGLWAVREEQERTRAALAAAVESRERAQQAEKEARANLERAEENFNLARRAVDEAFTRAADRPAEDDSKARQRLLEQALDYYRKAHSGMQGAK